MRSGEPELKAAVSIAEMSRMCSLSRSRFYQLLNDGVFPEPMRNGETGRPYYDSAKQEVCLRVRRTNCGINGRPVLFYCQRPMQVRQLTELPHKAANRCQKPKTTTHVPPSDPVIEQLRHGLEQLGMKQISDDRIRTALAEEHPDGYRNVDPATLLRSVFRSLRRQIKPDNVT